MFKKPDALCAPLLGVLKLVDASAQTYPVKKLHVKSAVQGFFSCGPQVLLSCPSSASAPNLEDEGARFAARVISHRGSP